MFSYNFESSKIEFDCLATGSPRPQVLWYKNDKIISEEDIGTIRNSMILSIKYLYKSDSGTYHCKVFNQFGEINRKFNLNVLEKESSVQAITFNDSAIVKCLSKSNNNIKWFAKLENPENIQDSNQIEISGESYQELDLTKIDYPQSTDLFLNTDFKSQVLNLNFENIKPKNYLNMFQLNDGSLFVRNANEFISGEYICGEGSLLSSKRVKLMVIHAKNILMDLDMSPITNESQFLTKDTFKKTPVIVITSLITVSIIIILSLVAYYQIKLKTKRPEQITIVNNGQNLNRVSNSNVLLHQLRIQQQQQSVNKVENFRARRYSCMAGVPAANPTQVYAQSSIYRSQLNPSHKSNQQVYYNSVNPLQFQQVPLYQHQFIQLQQQQQNQHQHYYQQPSYQSTRLNFSSNPSSSNRSSIV